MPEIKPRVGKAALQSAAPRDTTHDFDDVTVLFAAPPELLQQAAARDDHDEEVTRFHTPPSGSWNADEEATVAVHTSFALPELEPLRPLITSPTRPAPPQPRLALETRPVPPQPRPAFQTRPVPPRPRPPISRPAPVEIGEAELGAILGPRRAARYLALFGVLVLVLVVLAVARIAP